MKKRTKITARERDLLAQYLAEGNNKSECARKLKRPRKTVVEEIKRNSTWVKLSDGRRELRYISISAQAKAEGRKAHANEAKHPLKNRDIYAYTIERLRWGWSPEQIAGRLRKDNLNDPRWHICHETIYRWIYQKGNTDNGKPWYEYLRRKQKKRKRKTSRKVHRCQIPDRVSIHKRPKRIDNRTEFGHWESDSVEGPRSKKAGLHTEVERMSRRIKALKVKDLSSQEALDAQVSIFEPEPPTARKSTTHDNGKETHKHYKLRSKLGMDTYHADPYSSYQRGTNEHGNWHIRYYFPKGTDFDEITDEELQEVVEEINNRPRKILGYRTANEAYYELLKKAQGVTIGS